jgi:hypothetical protein
VDRRPAGLRTVLAQLLFPIWYSLVERDVGVGLGALSSTIPFGKIKWQCPPWVDGVSPGWPAPVSAHPATVVKGGARGARRGQRRVRFPSIPRGVRLTKSALDEICACR